MNTSTQADLEGSQNDWPVPEYRGDREPHFLFLITPPYSGSTAIAKVLNTGSRTMLLHHTGEGQLLIPALAGRRRWRADMFVDYESIRAIWLTKYHEVNEIVGGIEAVIEKSPPNMVRIDRICEMFSNYSFLANNRNPYAICASTLYRTRHVETMDNEQRQKSLRRFSKGWIQRSEIIKTFVERYSAPLITYEQFCERPERLRDKLALEDHIKNSINFNEPIAVKDYPEQTISNQNSKQIALLSNQDLDTISSILRSHEHLLDYFGYASL
jgi:hypothetical protein